MPRIPGPEIRVSGLDAHTVAVKGTGCGADTDDGCAGALSEFSLPPAHPVMVQVNVASMVTDPGYSGVLPGTEVQVDVALTDTCPARTKKC